MLYIISISFFEEALKLHFLINTINEMSIIIIVPSLQALCVNNIVQEELDISPLPPKLQSKILKTMKSS